MASLFMVIVMDKKTILIVGCGDSPTGRYGRLWGSLSRIMDIEVIHKTINDDLVGIDPLARGLVIHDELLHMDFSDLEDRVSALVETGSHWSKMYFDEKRGIRTTTVLPNEYWVRLEKPADHPTRKREPKGPRNKWGKLK